MTTSDDLGITNTDSKLKNRGSRAGDGDGLDSTAVYSVADNGSDNGDYEEIREPGRTTALTRIMNKLKIKKATGETPNSVFKGKPEGESGRRKLFVPRNRPRSTALGIVFGTIKVLAAIFIMFGFAAAGAVLGIAKAYVDTTPSLDISSLTVSERTSYIYDSNGDMITTFANMQYRDWVDIEDIPDMLKNALISIEDVRFYSHGGLDFKRLFSAIINTLRNTNTHGGSTLTQQLIKNKVLSNERSYKRKIQEAYLAYELENTISKDEILEAYMNDVYLGDSNYGFKAAANDYFGKDLNELTIRECAMLAGMVQKPNFTNPRSNTYSRFYEDGSNKMDVTDARTDVVLKAMYESGVITKQQYNEALEETVNILEVSAQKELYDMPYFVEYAVHDIITHMLKQRQLPDTKTNRADIERELRTGGYHIYLTVDPDIQNSVQSIITNWEDYPELSDPSAGITVDGTSGIKSAQPQASAVIIDQHTGDIKAIIGGREEPTMQKQLNRAYQSSMPVGSSIKPLTVYGPALDLGVSPGTGILNSQLSIDGYGGERGYPQIGPQRWEGIRTIRRGVTSSLNIVAARTLFDIVTPQVGASYLENLGISPSRINVDGPGLALGTSGITPIEMAAAYATIANGGVYLEPLSFSVVLDANGNEILNSNDIRQTRRIYKETSSYMLIDMMKDVVKSGTGTSAAIDGITVAGKTGTNDDYTSVYFAGFTGYYTASLWIGHDNFAIKLASGSTGGNSAAPLWQAFMSQIHEGLSDRPIMDVSPADIGLAKVRICPVSGKIATEACEHDENNPPTTDWCAVETMPSEYCDVHCMVNICTVSQLPAAPNCPAECRVEECTVLIHPDSLYARLDDSRLFKYLPNAVRTELTTDQYGIDADPANMCNIHSSATLPVDVLITSASALIDTVEEYLANVQTLSDSDRETLENGIIALRRAMADFDAVLIVRRMDELRYNYEVMYAANPPVTGP